MIRIRRFSTAALAALTLALPLRAVDYSWNSLGGGFWNTSANWSPVLPGTGMTASDRAIFNPSAQNQLVTLESPVSLNVLDFLTSPTTPNGGYTLFGAPMTISSSIRLGLNSTEFVGSHRIQSDVTLTNATANIFSRVRAGETATFTNAITGNGSNYLNIDGLAPSTPKGTTILSGPITGFNGGSFNKGMYVSGVNLRMDYAANTFQGGMSIQGTDTVVNVPHLGALGSGVIDLGFGATLRVTGSGGANNTINIPDTGTIRSDAIAGSLFLTGSGALAKTGTGTASFGGTYTGALNLTAGTTMVEATLGAGATITVQSGATIVGAGIANAITLKHGSFARLGVDAGGSLTIDNAAGSTVSLIGSGVFTGTNFSPTTTGSVATAILGGSATSTIQVNFGANVALSAGSTGPNAFTGAWQLTDALLSVNAANALGNRNGTAPASISVNAGGRLTLGATDALLNHPLTLAGGSIGTGSANRVLNPASITLATSTSSSLSGFSNFSLTVTTPLTGSGALGTGGTVILTTANPSYTGAVSIGGVLQLGDGGAGSMSAVSGITSIGTATGSTLNQATLLLQNNAGTPQSRLGSNVPVKLMGGAIRLNGSNSVATVATEQTGAMTIGFGTGKILVVPGTTGGVDLLGASIVRQPGGLLLATSGTTSLGFVGAAAAMLRFTDTSNITGTNLVGGAGSGGFDTPILPWARIDTVSLTGTGNTFATYGPNGFRGLDTTTEFASSLPSLNNNVRLTPTNNSMTASTSVNSLLMQNSSFQFLSLGGNTLTLNSGVYHSNAAGQVQISNGTIDFNGREASLSGPYTTFSTKLTNTNGMTITGWSEFLNTTSDFTGPIYLSGRIYAAGSVGTGSTSSLGNGATDLILAPGAEFNMRSDGVTLSRTIRVPAYPSTAVAQIIFANQTTPSTLASNIFVGNRLQILGPSTYTLNITGTIADDGPNAGSLLFATSTTGIRISNGANSFSGGLTYNGGILEINADGTPLGTGQILYTTSTTSILRPVNADRTISNAIRAVATQPLTVDGTFSLRLSGPIDIVAITAGTRWTIDSTTTSAAGVQLDSLISGEGNIGTSGAGRVFFNNANNSYSGSTRLNGVTIVGDVPASGPGPFGNSLSAIEVSTSGRLLANSSAIVGRDIMAFASGARIGAFTMSGSPTFTGATTLNGTLFLVGPTTTPNVLTLSGIVTGFSGLTTESGTTLLSGVNAYSGSTTIVSGTKLIAAAPYALGATSTGTVVTNGGTLSLTGNHNFAAEPLTLNGTGFNGAGALENLSGFNRFAGNITLATNAAIGVKAGTLTAAGTISGTGFSLTKSGDGTLVMPGVNTYSGGTIVAAGILGVNGLVSGSPIGSGSLTINRGTFVLNGGSGNTTTAAAGTLSVFDGATIRVNTRTGVATTLSAGAISRGTTQGTLVAIGGTDNLGSAAATAERILFTTTSPATTNGIVAAWMVGAASGASAAGTFLSYGANGLAPAAYSPSTDINSAGSTAVFDAATNQTLTGSRTVYAVRVGGTTISGGFGLTIGSGTDPAGAIFNGGTIANNFVNFGGREALIYTGAAGGTIGSGTTLLGSGGLTKFGPGVLTVNGTLDVSGTLAINGGAIAINGTVNVGSGNSLVVGNGQTLGGTGNIAGNVNVQPGGIVAPGNSPGVLTIGGTTTLSGDALVQIELGGTSAGQFDQINLGASGTINLGGATLSVSLINGYTPMPSDVLVIVTSGAVNAVTNTFFGLPDGAQVSVAGGYFAEIDYGSSQVSLINFQPVPEPGCLLLIAGAAGMMLRRRKRVA